MIAEYWLVYRIHLVGAKGKEEYAISYTLQRKVRSQFLAIFTIFMEFLEQTMVLRDPDATKTLKNYTEIGNNGTDSTCACY